MLLHRAPEATIEPPWRNQIVMWIEPTTGVSDSSKIMGKSWITCSCPKTCILSCLSQQQAVRETQNKLQDFSWWHSHTENHSQFPNPRSSLRSRLSYCVTLFIIILMSWLCQCIIQYPSSISDSFPTLSGRHGLPAKLFFKLVNIICKLK